MMQVERPSEGQYLMPVIWYFAPPGAKTYYGVNAFVSGIQDRDDPELPYQLGEQPPYERPWYNGKNVWGYTGQCIVGTPDQFANGLSAADLAAPPAPLPLCCTPVPTALPVGWRVEFLLLQQVPVISELLAGGVIDTGPTHRPHASELLSGGLADPTLHRGPHASELLGGGLPAARRLHASQLLAGGLSPLAPTVGGSELVAGGVVGEGSGASELLAGGLLPLSPTVGGSELVAGGTNDFPVTAPCSLLALPWNMWILWTPNFPGCPPVTQLNYDPTVSAWTQSGGAGGLGGWYLICNTGTGFFEVWNGAVQQTLISFSPLPAWALYFNVVGPSGFGPGCDANPPNQGQIVLTSPF
jgi:hypothetical protein